MKNLEGTGIAPQETLRRKKVEVAEVTDADVLTGLDKFTFESQQSMKDVLVTSGGVFRGVDLPAEDQGRLTFAKTEYTTSAQKAIDDLKQKVTQELSPDEVRQLQDAGNMDATAPGLVSQEDLALAPEVLKDNTIDLDQEVPEPKPISQEDKKWAEDAAKFAGKDFRKVREVTQQEWEDEQKKNKPIPEEGNLREVNIGGEKREEPRVVAETPPEPPPVPMDVVEEEPTVARLVENVETPNSDESKLGEEINFHLEEDPPKGSQEAIQKELAENIVDKIEEQVDTDTSTRIQRMALGAKKFAKDLFVGGIRLGERIIKPFTHGSVVKFEKLGRMEPGTRLGVMYNNMRISLEKNGVFGKKMTELQAKHAQQLDRIAKADAKMKRYGDSLEFQREKNAAISRANKIQAKIETSSNRIKQWENSNGSIADGLSGEINKHLSKKEFLPNMEVIKQTMKLLEERLSSTNKYLDQKESELAALQIEIAKNPLNRIKYADSITRLRKVIAGSRNEIKRVQDLKQLLDGRFTRLNERVRPYVDMKDEYQRIAAARAHIVVPERIKTGPRAATNGRMASSL